VFRACGYLIALATVGIMERGFQLEGWAAVLLFALVILYFRGLRRIGGTVFRRLLGVAPQRGEKRRRCVRARTLPLTPTSP
jgi:hypothetical protein